VTEENHHIRNENKGKIKEIESRLIQVEGEMKCVLAQAEREGSGECKEVRVKVSRIYLQVEKLREQLHNGKRSNMTTSPGVDATGPSGRDSVVHDYTSNDDNRRVNISRNLRSEGGGE
jgi:hypothetical protein